MSEIKYLSQCTDAEQEAAYRFYLTSFAHYNVEYDEAKQRSLIDKLLQSDWFDALIYFELDVPRGFCFFTKTYSSLQASMCLQIDEIFVTPESRNRGIGTQLLQYLIKHSEQHQIAQIFLTADARSPGTVGFYERLGFKPRENVVPVRRMILSERES